MRSQDNIASSFRDSSGFLFYKNNLIYRQINISYKDNYDHLMKSGLYKILVDQKLLIPHKEVDVSSSSDHKSYKIIRINEKGQEFVVDAPTTKALGLDRPGSTMADFKQVIAQKEHDLSQIYGDTQDKLVTINQEVQNFEFEVGEKATPPRIEF